MEIKRKKALNELLNFSESIDALTSKLKCFSWNFEGEPVLVRTSHLVSVLNRFVQGELTKNEIEKWANIIECREDLENEESDDELINKIIYELANPLLEGDFTLKRCRQYLLSLEK